LLLLSDAEVAQALPFPECLPDAIDALEEAERAYALGRTREAQRVALYYAEEGQKRRSLIVNPGIIAGVGAAARVFASSTLTREEQRKLVPRRLRGITAVFAYEDMGMIAAVEDGYIHEIRTAAPTGVAARHLASPDARELAIIGSGHLAAGQLAAVCAVRPIERIRVYSRTPEHASRFATRAAELLRREVRACASGREAVDGADVVITVTTARAPVIERAWLAPGATVLSVARNEVDDATVFDSRIVTPSVERLMDPDEAFEPFATLAREGRAERVAPIELSDVVVGREVGRASPNELVTFVSGSWARWDVAIPLLAVRRAQELGIGLEWP
jgi:ornithine cyclodeaminase/alanine dehydrogenase-like protein (mu-crystallin family)